MDVTRSKYPIGALCSQIAALSLLFGATTIAGAEDKPAYDLSSDKVLYVVGYAHLDTQWRWDFTTTIDRYLIDTLDHNFDRFEEFPGYIFNFTGAVRYDMMKEYYPQRYETMKKYIAAGRWHVSGSSVDEGDVNVVSPESVIRQILYGNAYFRKEFGKESLDYMLPDCFGFPATLPSIWAHCGLIGFSTQKLSWGSAVGIPFGIGMWEGPDGNAVMAALDPGPYAGALRGRVDKNKKWTERINENGEKYGVYADYHYYGVGDMGGAAKAEDVRNYLASVDNPDSNFHLHMASSDELYQDLTDEMKAKLPRYKGDMLLTEHSSGTITSQAYMKRWNRKNEQLADAAERAAVAADWLGAAHYPGHKLWASWFRTLANQMHDILPGTSIPRAYTYSWNDEILAGNGFQSVLSDSVAGVIRGLDTQVAGLPLVVYNPLEIEREDLVEAKVMGAMRTKAVRVYDASGNEVPSQIISRDGALTVLFSAKVAPLSWTVFDVRPSEQPYQPATPELKVSKNSLENAQYRVRINANGDVESIFDKQAGRELLSGPAQLVFTHEQPRSFPAWNMDWTDRQRPPLWTLEAEPQVRVVEDGPVRVALEITREAHGSIFTQTLRLATGDAGSRVEFATNIDWQTTGGALRAALPLTVSNPLATYNWGAGTIERGNNEPTKYEVPSHEWFDLTDTSGDYGVTVVENCKFGSDKPSDSELRLTLLYTPQVRDSYMDQHSQDWGKHEILYGLYGHQGDWRTAQSLWQGRRVNQPLRVFTADKHAGQLGKAWSLAKLNSPQVMLHAVKQAEEGDLVVVRLQEFWGSAVKDVRLSFASPIADAYEIDGQERRIGEAQLADGALTLDMTPYAIRSFAVRLGSAPTKLAAPQSKPVELAFDCDVLSRDANRQNGRFDPQGRTIPGEQLPSELVDGGIRFVLGSSDEGELNAVACRGQKIALPSGDYDRVHLLMAAAQDTSADFIVGSKTTSLDVQSWTGFIGQWYDRTWDTQFGEVDYRTEGKVTGLEDAYIKPGRVAWFCTHRHSPSRGNESYHFSYLFQYVLDLPAGATELQLPDDPSIRIMAVSVSKNANIGHPAAPLYDDFSDVDPIEFRYEYPPPPPPVFKDIEPLGKAEVDRQDSFGALKMGAPRTDDYADISQHADIMFRFDPIGNTAPHIGAGRDGDKLAAFNDGKVARNQDDPPSCIWWDSEGRFFVDLHQPVEINSVKTYSWHRSNRAPQFYSLWGATGDEMPMIEFTNGQQGPWKLLAVVNSRELGEGGVHGSAVTAKQAGQSLGKYRYLLWVIEPQRQGTFYTEVDIDAQP